MKCPLCRGENPDDKTFCRHCGAPLTPVCPACGAVLLPEDRFCGECGEKVGPGPDQVEGHFQIERERKNVTVLFSDLSGYTAMTERLDPEEVNDVMGRIFGEIAQVIAKHEGFIERFMGDAVMAVFGIPRAHEDDPVRAIRAASEIHAAVGALSPQLEEKIGGPLTMHTGINTGLVVTDEVNPGKGTHGITGDPVNLASRLVNLARAGEILIGEQTFRRAEGYFVCEPLEPRRIKGKEKVVTIYRVKEPSTRRTRFDVSFKRGLTPLVGRAQELALLMEAFHQAGKGNGQAFSIVSEAGLGKSRLLYEFKKAIAGENVTFLEAKCLSYSRGLAYHPVTDMLKKNFGIREGDHASEIRRKVMEGLDMLAADEPPVLASVLELLSAKKSGIEKIPASPEARKDRMLKALVKITVRGSKIRPLIMAVEDLHWMDQNSQDAFKELMEALSGTRILLILTHRPEFLPPWHPTAYHQQIRLDRLSRNESVEMMRHLLGPGEIDRSLIEFIMEKTEGIPLFIEEFIKSFKDLGLIDPVGGHHLTRDVGELFIPSTIQDVIRARIDTLPPGTKELLQVGSVIEKEFSHALVAHITNISEQDLRSRLSTLKDAELIYERGIYPQSIYAFKHALTREVVYESILKKKKKRLHGQIADAMTELFRDNIAEFYGVLAEHYIASENYERGAEYARLAGKRAQRECSYGDAIAYCQKGITCLEHLPITQEVQEDLIDARTTLAGYYNALALFSPAYEAVAPIAETAEKLNYQKGFPRIYNTIGLYSLWVEEDHEKGYAYLNRVLDFSPDPGNYFFVWMANYHMGWHLSWDGAFEKGLAHFENCIKMSSERKDPVGLCWAKGTMSAMNLSLQGAVDHAYRISDDALILSQECDDIFAQINTFTSQGLSYYLKGAFNEAETHLLMGEAMAERFRQVSWWAWTSGFLGDMYADLGSHENARKYYRQGIDILRKARLAPSWISTWEIGILREKVRNGLKEVNAAELTAFYEANNLRICNGRNARHIGEIFLNLGEAHLPGARQWVEKAVQEDTRNRARWQLGRDYAVMADVLAQEGDGAGAKECTGKAVALFRECGADGWAEKTAKALSKIT